MNASCLGDALDCAERGWRVVPVRGKNPGGFLGSGWQHRATTEPPVIEEWFERWPAANVGVVVGESFLPFDVDPRRGDDDALHELEHKLGPLPTTPSYLTGGPDGGWRLLFEHPGVDLRHDIDGVEIKHGDRMIVMPGSRHPDTGRPYVWDEHPDEVPLARLPEPWRWRLLRPAPPTPRQAPRRDDGDFLRGLEPARYVADLAGVAASPGMTIRCPLPDHDDRTPSFHVYRTPERGWFCYGCRRGGTIYDFAAHLAGYQRPIRGSSFLEVEGLVLSFYEARLVA